MSNIINILSSEKTTSNNSVNTSTESSKSAPSLFDSLLSANLPKEEVVVPNNSSKQEVVPATVTVEKVEVVEVVEGKVTQTIEAVKEEGIEEVNKVVDGSKESNEKQSVTTNTTSSLLDRLIIEAKKEVKDNSALKSENTLNNKIDSTLVKTQEVVPATVTVEKVEVVEVVEGKVTQTIEAVKEEGIEEVNKVVDGSKESNEKQSVTTNTTSSLLDRLIIEAKKEVKDNSALKSENTLNNKIDSTLVKTQEVVPATVTVEKVEVVEGEVTQTIEAVKEEGIEEVNKVVDGSKESNEKQSVTTNTTSSLLDRLIIEAKKEVKDNSALKSENTLNNKIDSTLVKTQEVVPATVTVEKVEVVEGEVTQTIEAVKEEGIEEVNKVVDGSKESNEKQSVTTNTTSSLLDRLIIEAKKEVKDNSVSEDVTIENKVIASDNEISLKNITSDNSKTLNINSTMNENITSETFISEDIKEVEKLVTSDIEEISLMDKLIKRNSEKLVLESTVDNSLGISEKEIFTKDLITNIYLGSQKNQVSNQSLFNKNEAVNILKDGNSIQAVKTSAEILELGLQEVEIQQTVEQKQEIKKSNLTLSERKISIDNILSQKNIKSEEIKNLITQSVEASKALLENNLTIADDTVVNVNAPLSYNIQSKIIGAKQQMSTMMSDIARQMYENYKPPVTAFRINLNPVELGSIAILMKNDKNSGLSISMNISNNTTLETLMENQNILKNSLNKSFEDGTKFNLDFNSSNENSSNQSSSNQNNQESNRNFEQQIDTQSILQLKEENKDREEKILDYM